MSGQGRPPREIPVPTLRYLYAGKAADGHEGLVILEARLTLCGDSQLDVWPCACGAPLTLDPRVVSRSTEYGSRCLRLYTGPKPD